MIATTKTILVVDDDRELVEATRRLLEEHGFRVLTAHDGASGLAAAKKERPALMILDAMMATRNEGFEISRKIRQIPELASMPVLMVTGMTREMNLPFNFEPDPVLLPVDAVLEKPVPPEKLLAAVRQALGA